MRQTTSYGNNHRTKIRCSKTKLVKIFFNNTEVPTTEFNEMSIKLESTYPIQTYADRNTYNQNNYEKKNN